MRDFCDLAATVSIWQIRCVRRQESTSEFRSLQMSLTLPGWLPLRSKGLRREQLDLETCKARRGKLNEAEADAARLADLSRLRSSSWSFGRDIRGAAGTSILAAVAFLLVAGIGAVTSYVGNPHEATGSGDTISLSLSRSGSNGEMLARLIDYTRSIETEEPASMAAADQPLPEVNTMIERLAARTRDHARGHRRLADARLVLLPHGAL